MRINRVAKARADTGSCIRCHQPVLKGQAYEWVKGRYTSKRVKHAACSPFRPSEMTGSDKKSRLYGAQEDVEDAIASAAKLEGKNQNRQLRDILVAALDSAAETADEVAQEYHDAAEADEHQGGIYQKNEETAGEVEGWAEELRSASSDVENVETAQPRDTYRSEVTDLASGALQTLSL